MDGVQVWWGWTGQARGGHTRLLDDTERARRERYRSEEARDQFTVGCAITRLVLAELTGEEPEKLVIDRECARCAGPHGKPRLVGGDIRFSVSHSGERVGVAFAPGVDVGLDVERIGRVDADRGRLAELVLAPDELPSWRDLPEPRRTRTFYTHWTRKESVLKATGDGLGVPMTELRVGESNGGPRLLAYPGGAECSASMYDLDAGPDYAAALTVLGPVAGLVVRDAVSLLAP